MKWKWGARLGLAALHFDTALMVFFYANPEKADTQLLLLGNNLNMPAANWLLSLIFGHPCIPNLFIVRVFDVFVVATFGLIWLVIGITIENMTPMIRAWLGRIKA